MILSVLDDDCDPGHSPDIFTYRNLRILVVMGGQDPRKGLYVEDLYDSTRIQKSGFITSPYKSPYLNFFISFVIRRICHPVRMTDEIKESSIPKEKGQPM
jgi:hypothetical protein